MVFGDFDADGLDGLAILVLALRRFGLAVDPYVPSRLDEGHGLSLAAVDAAVERRDRRSSSRSTAARPAWPRSPHAVERGIDVIVTDHHRVPAVLPPAVAIVNPHRPDATLSGPAAGRQRRRLQGRPAAPGRASPGGPAAALDLADLATIGTVADVAPIVGENRAIARLGLERIRNRPRARDRRPARAARIAPATATSTRSRSPSPRA